MCVLVLIVSFIFKQDTQEEWRNVFYVCAGFTVFGAVVFGLFVSGEVQEWAKDKDYNPKDNEMTERRLL
jgi:anaerobic C4-dicarboxylate transporter